MTEFQRNVNFLLIPFQLDPSQGRDSPGQTRRRIVRSGPTRRVDNSVRQDPSGGRQSPQARSRSARSVRRFR